MLQHIELSAQHGCSDKNCKKGGSQSPLFLFWNIGWFFDNHCTCGKAVLE